MTALIEYLAVLLQYFDLRQNFWALPGSPLAAPLLLTLQVVFASAHANTILAGWLRACMHNKL